MKKDCLFEDWKDIKEFERYQISTLGRVKSKPSRTSSGGIIKTRIVKTYEGVTLLKDGKRYNKLVHRLVAQAFIPNPNNLPCVNHKDENHFNNCVSNLEWCDYAYNDNYGNRNKKISKAMRNHPNLSYHVNQYTLDGEFVREWASTKEIQRETNKRWRSSNISRCCRGINKHAYGYIWRYE